MNEDGIPVSNNQHAISLLKIRIDSTYKRIQQSKVERKLLENRISSISLDIEQMYDNNTQLEKAIRILSSNGTDEELEKSAIILSSNA